MQKSPATHYQSPVIVPPPHTDPRRPRKRSLTESTRPAEEPPHTSPCRPQAAERAASGPATAAAGAPGRRTARRRRRALQCACAAARSNAMAPLPSLVKYDNPVQVGAGRDAKAKGLKGDKLTKKVRARGLHLIRRGACCSTLSTRSLSALLCITPLQQHAHACHPHNRRAPCRLWRPRAAAARPRTFSTRSCRRGEWHAAAPTMACCSPPAAAPASSRQCLLLCTVELAVACGPLPLHTCWMNLLAHTTQRNNPCTAAS